MGILYRFLTRVTPVMGHIAPLPYRKTVPNWLSSHSMRSLWASPICHEFEVCPRTRSSSESHYRHTRWQRLGSTGGNPLYWVNAKGASIPRSLVPTARWRKQPPSNAKVSGIAQRESKKRAGNVATKQHSSLRAKIFHIGGPCLRSS